MTDKVTVSVNWERTMTGQTDIEVEVEPFLRWVNEGNPPTDPPITLDDVDPQMFGEYLRSGDEQKDWIDHIDPHFDMDDGVDQDDYRMESVERVTPA